MENFRKSIKDFFSVNHEAGLLRLIFAAILTFILWSVLAAISAALKPLGIFDFRIISGFNSNNLALSLFLDILNAYFSFFSFILLILYFFITFFSFNSIVDFFSSLEYLPSKKISKSMLTSFAFSFPKRKIFIFPDDFRDNSENAAIGSLDVLIKPGYAILVSSMDNYNVIFNLPESPADKSEFISFGESVIDCFNLNPVLVSFNTEDQTTSKSYRIEMEYSFVIPADHESNAKLANMLAMCKSQIIRSLIERFLSTEINLALNQFFRDSPKSSNHFLVHAPEKLLTKKGIKIGESKVKTHAMIISLSQKIRDKGSKRNRKRLLYRSPAPKASSVLINQKENLSVLSKNQLDEIFQENLKCTLMSLFGADIIKAKIINFFEQG